MPETTVHQVYITVRRPTGANDPGQVEVGHYVLVDGIVTLTDDAGVPLKRGSSQLTTRTVRGARDAPLWSAAVPADQSDRQVAGRLLHSKFSSQRSGSDFNRPLPTTVPTGWR
jgi:hypothetical protein